jgi:hypothetical protein
MKKAVKIFTIEISFYYIFHLRKTDQSFLLILVFFYLHTTKRNKHRQIRITKDYVNEITN